jgi:hypothetical protein
MALSEAEREQARRIAIELKGTGERCMFWHHTPEGYEFWVDVFSKLVAIGEGDSETDPAEYAENLKLEWTDGFYGVSHSDWLGVCSRLEVHFMEAKSAIKKSEDGDYIEELVDVILPWEVD